MCISALFAGASSLSTAISVASTALSAVGAFQQAQAQRQQAEYNAAVARNNATIAEQNARDIVQRGEVARDIQQRRVAQTVGAARAAIAGSGLLVDDSPDTTPAALLDDLRVAGQFDIMTLKSNIDREARRARIEGDQFVAQAGLFDLQASSINPALAAAASFADNARSIFNQTPSGQVFPGSASSVRPRARPADILG